MTVSMTFPDGSKRDYDAALTGALLAEGISKSLAKKAVAYALNGEVRDLSDPLGVSGNIEIITRDDKRALELIRHDAAHVMAEAVQELFPGTQVTIGPVIENGFYYDFKRLDESGKTRPPADRRPGRLRRPCWSCGPFWAWNPRGPGLTTVFDVGRVAVRAAA